MRQYRAERKEICKTEKIICNKCGREIPVIQGVAQEDFLAVTKRWGYFSEKDNREDQFELCEKCYDELVAGFKYKI